MVAASYLGWNTDAVARPMLVGEWQCDPHFSPSPHDLTFVRDGYAEFDTAGKAVAHGIWDVWRGRLIEIDSGGGSTGSKLRVSFPPIPRRARRFPLRPVPAA
jgi:hypothetical protein